MSLPHLTRALVLEEERLLPDGAGGHQKLWAMLGTHWAEVQASTGRDPDGEERVLSAVNWRITLRASPAGSELRPRPDQRLREGMRIFTILAVAERDRAGRYLTCFCREEVLK